MESTQTLPRPATVPLADRKSHSPCIEREIVDLNVYPGSDTSRVLTKSDIFWGDMHGNSKKLMYHLIKEGIFSVSKGDYAQFVKIYDRSEALTVEDRAQVDVLIGRVTLKSNPQRLHLIGDLLADRGKNDYLTLKIIEKMGILGVNYDILFSNHDAWFLQALDMEMLDSADRSCNSKVFVASLHGFKKVWCIMNQAERSGIRQIIDRHYKPKLKLLSGIVTQNGIEALPKFFFISHAPLDLHESVQRLADYFDIPYKGKALADLVRVELEITQKFKNLLIHHPKNFWVHWSKQYDIYHTLKKSQKKSKENTSKEMTSKNLKAIPLVISVWNREYPSDFSWQSTEYDAMGIHGHESEGLSHSPYRYNLDNLLGKDAHLDQGEYLRLVVENAYSLEEWLARPLSVKRESFLSRYLCYTISGIAVCSGVIGLGGYIGATCIHGALGWGSAISSSPGIGQLSTPLLIALGGMVCVLMFLFYDKIRNVLAKRPEVPVLSEAKGVSESLCDRNRSAPS